MFTSFRSIVFMMSVKFRMSVETSRFDAVIALYYRDHAIDTLLYVYFYQIVNSVTYSVSVIPGQ